MKALNLQNDLKVEIGSFYQKRLLIGKLKGLAKQGIKSTNSSLF